MAIDPIDQIDLEMVIDLGMDTDQGTVIDLGMDTDQGTVIDLGMDTDHHIMGTLDPHIMDITDTMVIITTIIHTMEDTGHGSGVVLS
jgi:hypothetical protein